MDVSPKNLVETSLTVLSEVFSPERRQRLANEYYTACAMISAFHEVMSKLCDLSLNHCETIIILPQAQKLMSTT